VLHRLKPFHRAEIIVRKYGKTDPGTCQIRVVEEGLAQVRYCEVRHAEVRPAKVRSAKVRCAEVRRSEICPAEVRPTEVRSYQVRRADVRHPKVRSAEVRCGEVRPGEFRPGEVRFPEIRLDEGRPPKVWSYPPILDPLFVPSDDSLHENLEVFGVGHGLNLGNRLEGNIRMDGENCEE